MYDVLGKSAGSGVYRRFHPAANEILGIGFAYLYVIDSVLPRISRLLFLY
jgi:hypothetical protein